VKESLEKILKRDTLLIIIVALLGTSGYGYYYFSNQVNTLETRVAELETNLETTEGTLAQTTQERNSLQEALIAEQERVGTIADAVGEITGTVDDLEKLAGLDKELLQKYSKVFFLNEHYVPDKLRDIPKQYLYDESVTKQIDSRVWPFLRNLLEDAEDDGISIWIASAYRSFGTQSTLKTAYTVYYGSGANTFSADQGYSEHQLGTTVDFTTVGLGGGLSGFGNTEAYQWLTDNAYKYGFTLSYPEGNAYYIFEPWHWRFVGEDLARDLHRDERGFYNVPQRELDEYLLNIFD